MNYSELRRMKKNVHLNECVLLNVHFLHMRNLKVKYRKPSDFKETCKEFTAQVEEKASFDKYNINNSIDSINLSD